MTTTTTVDAYPSTFDAPVLPPLEADRVVDPRLELLERARERYEQGMTTRAYVRYDGSVCALGAIVVADGIRSRAPERWKDYEARLSRAARDAIALLDEVALELYPEARNWDDIVDNLCGPLEYLNQRGAPVNPWSDMLDWRKRRVLRVYDEAIHRLYEGVAA